MPIVDQFLVEFRLPAPAKLRRAHGLDDSVCSLVITRASLSRNGCSLASVAHQTLPNGELTVTFSIGDLASELDHAVSGLEPIPKTSAGCQAYIVSSRSALDSLFDVDLETISVFRASRQTLDSVLTSAEKVCASTWRKLSRHTETGALVTLTLPFGPVALYSPSEDSLEIFGSEVDLLEAFGRFQLLVGDGGVNGVQNM